MKEVTEKDVKKMVMSMDIEKQVLYIKHKKNNQENYILIKEIDDKGYDDVTWRMKYIELISYNSIYESDYFENWEAAVDNFEWSLKDNIDEIRRRITLAKLEGNTE